MSLVLGYLVVIAIILLVGGLQGTLTHADAIHVFARDVTSMVGIGETTAAESSTYFPVLRDYPSLIVISLALLNLLVVYRQWRLMERLLPQLRANGVLELRPGAEEDFAAHVVRLNESMANGSRNALWLMGAVAAAGVLTFAERESGIFWSVAPTDLQGSALAAWMQEAYRGWWASFDSHGAGFATYLVVATLIGHYVFAQNHVGVKVLWLFWKHRHGLLLRLNLLNPDGHYGWEIARRLFWTIYISLSIVAVSLLVLFQLLPLPQFPWVAFPWFFILLVVSPFYVVLPAVLLYFGLRDHKREVIGKLERLTTADPYAGDRLDLDELAEHLTIREEIERVRSIPVLPFAIKQLAVGMALYALPTIVGIAQLVYVIAELT